MIAVEEFFEQKAKEQFKDAEEWNTSSSYFRSLINICEPVVIVKFVQETAIEFTKLHRIEILKEVLNKVETVQLFNKPMVITESVLGSYPETNIK